jgi:hypothetical protein
MGSCSTWRFVCVLGLSFGLIGVPAAEALSIAACTCTFDLSSPSGVLGTTQTYTRSGPGGPVPITAEGFLGVTRTYTQQPFGPTITGAGFTDDGFATPINLFGKNDGGGEKGLGLTNDPTGRTRFLAPRSFELAFQVLSRQAATSRQLPRSGWVALPRVSPGLFWAPRHRQRDTYYFRQHRRQAMTSCRTGFPTNPSSRVPYFPFTSSRPQTGMFCSLLFRSLPVPSPVLACLA